MQTSKLRDALALVQGIPFGTEAASYLEMMADVLPIHVHPEGITSPSMRIEAVEIINGDLRVEGLLEGASMTHGTMLVVLGNLVAGDIIFHGPMFVTGDVTVKRAALFESQGDWGLFVGGSFRASVLVEHEHMLTIAGELSCEHVHRKDSDPRALLDAKLLKEEAALWHVEPTEIARAIREGRSLLRSTTRAV